MNDKVSYVRLPYHLFTDRVSVIASGLHDDEQFAAHQVEFYRHLFGRCDYLRARARDTPTSDAFVAVFVNLIDLLTENAPDEAAHCLEELQKILVVACQPGRGRDRGDSGIPSIGPNSADPDV